MNGPLLYFFNIRLDYNLVSELKNDLSYIKEAKKEAKKELRLYDCKTICNSKWINTNV